MIHTGDISHLSLEAQFDDADKVISQARLDVHYVPGEHDFLDPDQKFYLEPLRQRHQGRRLVSVRRQWRALHRPRQRLRSQGRRHGRSRRRAARMARRRLKGRSASTPIVVFAHIPLWTVYPQWGWGTDDGGAGAVLSQALRLGDRAQRPYPPGDAESGRQRHLPHRALDRVSAAGAGHRALARADEGSRSTSCAPCSASPTSRSSRTSSASPSSTAPLKG